MFRPRRKKAADPLPPWPPNSVQIYKPKYWKVTDEDAPKWSPDRPERSQLESHEGLITYHERRQMQLGYYDGYYGESELVVQKTLDVLKKCSTKTDKFMSVVVMNAAKDLKALCPQPYFTSEFLKQVNRDCPELASTIPDFTKALDALAHIPLDRFSSPKDVLTFVDALIESGIATQVEHGLVFVLGNTNIGKTSLVNTFTKFVASPSEEPVSVLTEGNANLIETQVLEVYDNLSLSQEKSFEVELSGGSISPVLVNLKEGLKSQADRTSNAGLQLKIVDLGKIRVSFVSFYQFQF